jgi:hypothetical protein
MKSTIKRLARIVLLITFCLSLSSCDDPQIYGSVGFSSYGGGGYYGGGPRIGTSVTIGGRIR